MASIKDVAKDAGVSIASVSFVINGTKSLSPEVEKRIRDSIKKLNYSTNYMARGLRNKSTNTIGVVLQNIRNPFFPAVLAGMEEAVRDYSYTLLFMNSINDLDTEKKSIISLINMGVDGIIVDTCVEESYKYEYTDYLYEKLNTTKKSIPMVSIERSFCKNRFSYVTIDYEKASYNAVSYLINQGHKNIIHFTSMCDWDIFKLRAEGYRRAMAENNLDENVKIVSANIRAIDGYYLAGQVASSKPDAIFCTNDQMAIGAVNYFKDANVLIPDDIAVIGFDNISVTSITSPTISTVDVPRFKMGYMAISTLLSHINNNTEFTKKMLGTKLIIRGSTDISYNSAVDFAEL